MVDVKKIKKMFQKVTNKISNSKTLPQTLQRFVAFLFHQMLNPRVCKSQECLDQHEKNTRNEKQMRIWMFIFSGFSHSYS